MSVLLVPIGYTFGFVLPLVVGLYTCATNETNHTDFWLKCTFFWVIFNNILSPVLSVVSAGFSKTLWPVLYALFSVAIVIPKSGLVKCIDQYVILAINNDALGLALNAVREVSATFTKKVTDKAKVYLDAL